MDAAMIRQALEEKYLAPTRRERPLYSGIEVEMPILNLKKEAVDFDIVHKTAERFMDICGFVPEKRDDEGEVILAADPVTGDSLSFDCSYNNLELSLGKAQDLQLAKIRFFHYYDVLQELLSAHDYTLTGMGVNPYRIYNHNVPIPNGRYRMLFHHLHSYPKYRSLPMHFHHHPAFGTFSSASQVQLDVMDRDLITIFRAFSRLEPVKALLFSNSVLLGEDNRMICVRDMFWENSTHGINPHNVGMYECDFYSEDELLDYISSMSSLQSCIDHHQRADLLRVLDVDMMVRTALVDLYTFSPCAERGEGQFLPAGTAARQKRYGRKQGSIPDMAAMKGSPQVRVGEQELPVKEQKVQFVPGRQRSNCLIDDPAALFGCQFRSRTAV